MANDFVNSIIINGTETQMQDYGRDQPNGVPVLDSQGKLPLKYFTDNVGGESAAVGTLIQQYKKVPMSGYLYCDGSTFDQNDYPALYMYLGTNVLPDYRECVMVGAEQNTTDTIATHDVYGEGEFKDDQLQKHGHEIRANDSSGNRVMTLKGSNGEGTAIGSVLDTIDARAAETTHGKQKAVYVYIKATSGLAENQQENVLNDVKGYVDSSNSYSTNEVKTGGKWIDGKPIYRKVVDFGALSAGSKTVAHGINNLGDVTRIYGVARSSDNTSLPLPYASSVPIILYANTNNIVIEISNNNYSGYTRSEVTIEYTKTTD